MPNAGHARPGLCPAGGRRSCRCLRRTAPCRSQPSAVPNCAPDCETEMRHQTQAPDCDPRMQARTAILVNPGAAGPCSALPAPRAKGAALGRAPDGTPIPGRPEQPWRRPAQLSMPGLPAGPGKPERLVCRTFLQSVGLNFCLDSRSFFQSFLLSFCLDCLSF